MRRADSFRNRVFELRQEINTIAARHGVGKIALVGSTARQEDGSLSDIDFLIDVTGNTPPWFPGGLVAELESLLGRRVDVVELQAIRPSFRDSILRDATPL